MPRGSDLPGAFGLLLCSVSALIITEQISKPSFKLDDTDFPCRVLSRGLVRVRVCVRGGGVSSSLSFIPCRTYATYKAVFNPPDCFVFVILYSIIHVHNLDV